MITVNVLINGENIYARSAVNKGQYKNTISHKYKVDDGTIILHQRDKGAIELAIKMLQTIKEEL